MSYMPNTTLKLAYRSHLWLWLLISFIVHIVILIVLFIRFESLQFKKGTSNERHMKVAGFNILNSEQGEFQELFTESSISHSKSNINMPQISQNTQANQSFDLASLSLYDGKQNIQNSKQPSRIKALTKFPNINNTARRDIEELYGEEFGDYGLAEQEFLVNNLRDIGRITQRYLKYPPSAARLGQQGVSAVEFYLHPNGDISELKVFLSSDYMLLDRNSERTIEIAYKDYPHPQSKTKIRIFVSYGIYYYGY